VTDSVEPPTRIGQGKPLIGKRNIRDHRDLRVWRKARRLADQCREAVAAFPSTRASLAAVICRLANEVPSEIAAGQSQGQHAPYMDHLERSRTALRHLERRLIEAHKADCLPSMVGDPLLARVAEVERMLGKLMVSLEVSYAQRRLAK
jgi:four helix bundle protein